MAELMMATGLLFLKGLAVLGFAVLAAALLALLALLAYLLAKYSTWLGYYDTPEGGKEDEQ